MTSSVARVPGAQRPFARLLSVPLSDIGDMLFAQWEVVRSHWALRRKARGALLARESSLPDDGAPVSSEERAALTRIAVAVSRVGRFGLTRPTCLVRALAMERMIAKRGVRRAVVRIGVMQADGRFHAHAWIEVAGTIVGDSAARVSKFVPLADFSGLAQ